MKSKPDRTHTTNRTDSTGRSRLSRRSPPARVLPLPVRKLSEPTTESVEVELTAAFKALDEGRPKRPITADDEAGVLDEITKYRAEQRRPKA